MGDTFTPYECIYCTAKFSTEEELEEHIRLFHNEDNIIDQEGIAEMMANLHPTDIEVIVKYAIKQIIDDYEDYIEFSTDKSEKKYHRKMIKKWKGILNMIQEEK